MSQWQPRRVRVVGNSGAGKTTFARELARRIGVPHRELDEVFWDAGWAKRDPEQGRAILRDFLAEAPDGWVTYGNWNSVRQGLMDDADVIVWLDYPRRVVMPRVIRRTIARGLLRTELWHGNREQLRSLLRTDPEQNIVLWSWTQHTAYRQAYTTFAVSSPVPVVRLRHPRAARRWLRALPPT